MQCVHLGGNAEGGGLVQVLLRHGRPDRDGGLRGGQPGGACLCDCEFFM